MNAPSGALASIRALTGGGAGAGEAADAVVQATIKRAQRKSQEAAAPGTTGGAEHFLKVLDSALHALKPLRWESNDWWQPLAMAIHSECSKLDCLDEGFALFEQYAKAHKGYDKASNAKRFNSFSDKPASVRIGTLYRYALEDGWTPPPEFRGGFSVDADGVRALGLRDKGGSLRKPLLICGRIEIVADCSSPNGTGWCRLLRFTDRRGASREWLMPLELLAADGAELRAGLLNRGLWIADGREAHARLARFINSARDLPHGALVESPGWHGGAYVLHDRAIGAMEGGGSVMYRGGDTGTGTRGTLEDWRAHVAALAIGNARLMFAISCAFAAPLLQLVGIDGGGFNLFGPSSTGKTSIARGAASVWGGPSYVRSWRATANGLESAAKLANDSLLVLDELKEVAPTEAGGVAYMLSGGTGKQRMNRSGEARPAAQWRLLYLSTAELTLEQHAQAKGGRVDAGQLIRLVDIPSDSSSGHGVFETLHGRAGGAALSDEVVAAAAAHFGTAGVQWLEQLTADSTAATARARALLSEYTHRLLKSAKGAEGQAMRGATRFAIVATAGEMATAAGITNWKAGEALAAAEVCFRAWIDHRGGSGNQERGAILRQVRAFLEKHGASRFLPWQRGHKEDDLTISEGKHINRAGYIRHGLLPEGPVFYVLTETFTQEVAEGRNPRQVAEVLAQAGWLVRREGDKSNTRAERLPDLGLTRVYMLGPKSVQAEIT